MALGGRRLPAGSSRPRGACLRSRWVRASERCATCGTRGRTPVLDRVQEQRAGLPGNSNVLGKELFHYVRSRRLFSLRSRIFPSASGTAVKTSARTSQLVASTSNRHLAPRSASIALAGMYSSARMAASARSPTHGVSRLLGNVGRHRAGACCTEAGSAGTVPPSDCSSRFASLTRRDFLTSAAAAVVAAGAACAPSRPWKTARPACPRNPTCCCWHRDYEADLSDPIGRALRELGSRREGQARALKPNMVSTSAARCINTHPSVVRPRRLPGRRPRCCRRRGAGPSKKSTRYLVTATGLFNHLRDMQLAFVDLNLKRAAHAYTCHRPLPTVPSTSMGLNTDIVVCDSEEHTGWAGMT